MQWNSDYSKINSHAYPSCVSKECLQQGDQHQKIRQSSSLSHVYYQVHSSSFFLGHFNFLGDTIFFIF